MTGRYCAVAYGGNRIDCNPSEKEVDNISGVIKDNVAEVKFISYYRMSPYREEENIGKAEITLKNGKLYWLVTEPTKNGFYYCPDKATLNINEIAPELVLIKN